MQVLEKEEEKNHYIRWLFLNLLQFSTRSATISLRRWRLLTSSRWTSRISGTTLPTVGPKWSTTRSSASRRTTTRRRWTTRTSRGRSCAIKPSPTFVPFSGISTITITDARLGAGRSCDLFSKIYFLTSSLDHSTYFFYYVNDYFFFFI